MFGLPLAFAAPAVLAALVGLAALYFLLRVTPPRPRQAVFPPLRLLIGLDPKETTPARTPWPILALRLAIGALIILAMAEPLWNSLAALSGSGPLLVLIDDGLAGGAGMGQANRLRPANDCSAAARRRSNGRDRRHCRRADRTSRRSTGRHRGAAALARAGPLCARPRGGAAGDRALSRSRAEDRNPVDRRRGRARRRKRLFRQARVPSLGRSRS